MQSDATGYGPVHCSLLVYAYWSSLCRCQGHSQCASDCALLLAMRLCLTHHSLRCKPVAYVVAVAADLVTGGIQDYLADCLLCCSCRYVFWPMV